VAGGNIIIGRLGNVTYVARQSYCGYGPRLPSRGVRNARRLVSAENVAASGNHQAFASR